MQTFFEEHSFSKMGKLAEAKYFVHNMNNFANTYHPVLFLRILQMKLSYQSNILHVKTFAGNFNKDFEN